MLSVAVGVISKQLILHGNEYIFSGLSFILSYVIAAVIVAGLKAYHWPVYYSVSLIVLACVMNIVQIWQISKSDYEYTVDLMEHHISFRNTAIAAYVNATIFYLQQLFTDTYYKNCMPQMVEMEWKQQDLK